jgi:hypothetical protein
MIRITRKLDNEVVSSTVHRGQKVTSRHGEVHTSLWDCVLWRVVTLLRVKSLWLDDSVARHVTGQRWSPQHIDRGFYNVLPIQGYRASYAEGDRWIWSNGGIGINRRKPKKLGKTSHYCNFVHHESHLKSSRTEPEIPRWDMNLSAVHGLCLRNNARKWRLKFVAQWAASCFVKKF